MATFGTPWPSPRSLSISFPSDDASVGAFSNDLRERFDQVTDRQLWQEAVLRAFQTWSVHANINIGLVPDRGDHFGAIGLPFDDPRFGEFRIGAFAQSNTLANALPFQRTAGTWSGDVLLNTEVNYFLADKGPDHQVATPGVSDQGDSVELFSVLLHEAGNALGLADNNVSGAVMNGTYSGPNRTLKASDIASIRSLYGTRLDPFEATSNNSRAAATRITTPQAAGPTPFVVSVSGSLQSMADVDFYRFTPMAGREKVTVRLVAAGISLVKSKIEILDRFGNKIADAKADNVFDNDLVLELGSLRDHSFLFIKVSRNTDDVFAIGDYRLELDYRDPSLQPPRVKPVYDADLSDDDSTSVNPVDIDQLFASGILIDTEIGTNDTLDRATRLETTLGYLPSTRYDLQSSLSSRNDRDIWSFRAPAIPTTSLTVMVDPVGVSSYPIEAYVLTSEGDRVAAELNARPDGGFTIQVNAPRLNQEYRLFVRARPGTNAASVNYVASVTFATNAPDNIREIWRSESRAGVENFSTLISNRSQLFRFDLSSLSSDPNLGTQITIHDARTGDIVAAFASSGTSTQTEYVWLAQGSYILRATQRSRLATNTGVSAFRLSADVLSDDQGPRVVDPLGPLPDWNWESNQNATPPVVIDFFEPPFVNPWNSDFSFDFFRNFYFQFLA